MYGREQFLKRVRSCWVILVTSLVYGAAGSICGSMQRLYGSSIQSAMESERHKKKKANLTTAFHLYKNKKEEKSVDNKSRHSAQPRSNYCFASKRRIFFIVGERKDI